MKLEKQPILIGEQEYMNHCIVCLCLLMDYENHFYIEIFNNEEVDMEAFMNTFKVIGDNFSSISGKYVERATFVPDYE